MMKIKLVGTPGKIVQRGGTIVTVMECRKVPPLPGDLPTPAEVAVKYTIYIDERQWQKAAGGVEAELVIEGYCFYDAELKCLAVLAQSVMAKGQPVEKA